MEDNNNFSYTYSAKQQDEVSKIRNKYIPKEENKIETLRRLDAGVTKKASTISIIVGVIGALIMGLGMSLAMTNISSHLSLPENTAMIIGILIGFIGIALVCIAYPVYKKAVERERKRIAPEILRLTDEIIGNK